MFNGLDQGIFSGMYDTPNREMTAIQGRFMSPDPAGSGWNQYAWPTNPNSESDPLGLDSCIVEGGCGGGSGGGCDEDGDCPGDGGCDFWGDCWGDGYGPEGMPLLPPGGPLNNAAQGIFSGQDCLYCYPLGPSVLQIVQAVLSGNLWGALQGVGAIPQDPNCEFGACGDSFPGAMNATGNCTPGTTGCSNVPTAQQQQCASIYNSYVQAVNGQKWTNVELVGGGALFGCVGGLWSCVAGAAGADFALWRTDWGLDTINLSYRDQLLNARCNTIDF
jgi:hypothetical protein